MYQPMWQLFPYSMVLWHLRTCHAPSEGRLLIIFTLKWPRKYFGHWSDSNYDFPSPLYPFCRFLEVFSFLCDDFDVCNDDNYNIESISRKDIFSETSRSWNQVRLRALLIGPLVAPCLWSHLCVETFHELDKCCLQGITCWFVTDPSREAFSRNLNFQILNLKNIQLSTHVNLFMYISIYIFPDFFSFFPP